MAVKTITIDMEAYEALRRHKREGQSFSDVIKEHFGGKTTGRVLGRVVAALQVDEATLDEVERLIEARARDATTAAEL
jgi:predicted CopG family antitoxin